ncbi:hypothetical protein [Intrasporangium flavum]|uniref:hypothetical protein n=1 Tax=Intrasporangium flavum TaxID=1428657 RepID=UPI001A9719D5|nr:hypothetical protein [Intrasporangium flavum]
MRQPSSVTTEARRVSVPLRAAAVCALALAVVEVATLAGQAAPPPYVTVLLGVAATASAGVGVALARGGCAVSRTAAGVLAAAVIGGVLLLVTVGRPGGRPVPFGPLSLLALGLAGALLALLGSEAVRRRRNTTTGAKRAETDNLGHGDSRAARGGRPGHRADARHRTGA